MRAWRMLSWGRLQPILGRRTPASHRGVGKEEPEHDLFRSRPHGCPRPLYGDAPSPTTAAPRGATRDQRT